MPDVSEMVGGWKIARLAYDTSMHRQAASGFISCLFVNYNK